MYVNMGLVSDMGKSGTLMVEGKRESFRNGNRFVGLHMLVAVWVWVWVSERERLMYVGCRH